MISREVIKRVEEGFDKRMEQDGQVDGAHIFVFIKKVKVNIEM